MALDKGFTGKHPQWNAPYIFGIDVDERAFQNWSKITLSSYFPNEKLMRRHFRKQNGLIPLPKDILPYKRGGLQEFDCVVGNPPYGGVGLQKIDEELEDTLIKYRIWRKFVSKEKQLSLLPETLGRKNKEQLKKFPIEILFIDRFIQLTKPGGYIAIILPDGIFANSNLHYVRQFITDNTRVEAIISLPRGAFKNVGTSAKTSILFLRKVKEEDLDYNVFLGAVEDVDKLTKVYEYYSEYYKKGGLMNPEPKKVLVIKDPAGREAVTVRVDKTMREVMEACKTDTLKWSRWDAKYHLPILEYVVRLMAKNFDLNYLYELRKEIIVGDHIRARLNECYTDSKDGVLYLKSEAISDTGLLLHEVKKVSRNAYDRLIRSQPRIGDLLIAFGGSIGKILLIDRDYTPAITCDLCIFRAKLVNPFYLYVYLKTFFGRIFMNILKNGTGIEHLNSDEFQLIQIPNIPLEVQSHIEPEYKKMSVYHGKAMQSKAKNDEANYRKNIEIAEKMLKTLIAKTEAVIRGEREDVL